MLDKSEMKERAYLTLARCRVDRYMNVVSRKRLGGW